MDVYKENATGLFICKLCNKDYTSLQEAMECANSHPKTSVPREVQETAGLPVVTDIEEYKDLGDKEGLIKLNEKLCMSLIEDYLVSRSQDMNKNGKVSAMTLSLGKVAAEALTNLNKVNSVSKSVNVSVDAGKKSDISALKELMEGKQGGE